MRNGRRSDPSFISWKEINMTLTESQVKEKIKQYAPLFQKHKSPISVAVRMAQLGVESVWFTSKLAKNANNGFGIKASAPWNGESYAHYSDEVGGARVSQFRKYPNQEASIKDNADFYTSTDYRRDVAYKKAIEATNYKDEANALTGIYAGDPKYGEKLIKVIEKYNLTQYNEKEGNVNMAFPKPAMVDRRKQALGYPGHGVYAKRSKSAIKNIVWHYTATVRSESGAVAIKKHEDYWRGTHGWEIGGYAYYISRDGTIYWNYDLEVVTYGAGVVNPTTMHISCEASSASNYTAAQIKSREALTLWLLSDPLKHLNGNSMKGHKEFMSTSCPGYTIEQLNSYRSDLDKKLKSGGSTGSGQSTPVPSPNSVVWPEYRKPSKPFDALKVGDKVKIRKGMSAWFIPNNPKVGTKPSKDFTGDTDTITKVMDVNVSYSKKAYLLKDKVSWILEQDLEEARKSWGETVVTAKYHTVKSGEYLYLIGEKYGVTVAQIKDWNRLLTNVIYSGQKLYVEDPSKESIIPAQPALPEKEETIEAPIKDQPKDEGNQTPAIELKDGEFIWAGIKYQIVKK